MDYIQIAVKLIASLVMLLIILRLMGKKELSQVTPLDMILIIIIGDLAGGIAVDDNLNVLHLIFSLVFWAALILVLDFLKRRSKNFDKMTAGEPTLIILNGEVNESAKTRLRLTNKEINALLREKGVFEIEKVKIAYIEVSGQLSVLERDEI